MKRWYAFPMTCVWMLCATVCWAKPTMGYSLVEDRWNELRSKYPDEGCVIVRKDTEVTFVFTSYGDLTTVTRMEMIFGVLDLAQAPECLEHAYTLVPGEKLKEVTAWSHPHGGAGVTMAQRSDIRVLPLFGEWKQVRIAIPGISQSGTCGVVIVTENEGPPPFIEHFASKYPLEQGEFRLCVPSWDTYEIEEKTRVFTSIYHPVLKGNVQEIPPFVSKEKGYTRAFRSTAVPGQPKSTLVQSEDLPVADLYLVPRGFTWKEMMGRFHQAALDLSPPKQFAKAAKDTLGGASALERVQAISRFLDDPNHFQMLGRARDTHIQFDDLEHVARDRKGTAFDKTLLAYSLLRKLGTECYLVFGSSQYRPKPDWRVFDPDFLSAALIWVPEISNDFIWDVADRSTPIGWGGADLFASMLVVSEDPNTRSFPISEQGWGQKRCIEWELQQDGLLKGKLTWVFEGWPDPDMDPWLGKSGDLMTLVERTCPSGVKVKDVAWAKVDRSGMRCTRACPAVLVVDLESEAEPNGEAGWALVPFTWPAPSFLSGVLSKTKNAPIYFDRSQSIMDSIVVTLPEGFAPETMPEEIQGFVQSSWSKEGNKIVAKRVMSVPKLRVEASSVKDLGKVLDAWNACGEQKVAVGH